MIETRDPRPFTDGGMRRAAQRPPRSAGQREALLVALRDPAAWSDAAASLLADLGFRVMASDRASGDDAHLLVALRERPTLRHFDPEFVDYYAPAGGAAALTTVDRMSLGRSADLLERRALWGHVHLVDRLPVENRYLTFGGELRVAVIDSKLTVLDLWSPAPIVRWGGHSQGTDALAELIGAFFGRLIVPVDFVPGAEARIDALSPDILYRAFLIDAQERATIAQRRGAAETPLDVWLTGAITRARVDAAACRAATDLLVDLGFGSSMQATFGPPAGVDGPG